MKTTKIKKGKNVIVINYGLKEFSFLSPNRVQLLFNVSGYHYTKATSKQIEKGYYLETIDNEVYFLKKSGEIHDVINKYAPEFKDIIDLHGSDRFGVPLRVIDDGFYYLKNGFNDIKNDSELFPSEFCKRYRIPKEVFNSLNKVTLTKNEFRDILFWNNMFEKWKEDSNKIIKKYEI